MQTLDDTIEICIERVCELFNIVIILSRDNFTKSYCTCNGIDIYTSIEPQDILFLPNGFFISSVRNSLRDRISDTLSNILINQRDECKVEQSSLSTQSPLNISLNTSLYK